MIDKPQAVATLRNYILENYLFTDNQDELKNEESFLENKILDSMGILELIHFLQEEFGVKTEDEEMIPENLDSIDRLVAFIGRKSG